MYARASRVLLGGLLLACAPGRGGGIDAEDAAALWRRSDERGCRRSSASCSRTARARPASRGSRPGRTSPSTRRTSRPRSTRASWADRAAARVSEDEAATRSRRCYPTWSTGDPGRRAAGRRRARPHVRPPARAGRCTRGLAESSSAGCSSSPAPPAAAAVAVASEFAIYHLEAAIGPPGSAGELRCGPPRAECPGVLQQPPQHDYHYAVRKRLPASPATTSSATASARSPARRPASTR